MQIPQHVDPFKNHLGNVELNAHSVGDRFQGGTLLWHRPMTEMGRETLTATKMRRDLHGDGQGEGQRGQDARRQDGKMARWQGDSVKRKVGMWSDGDG